MRTMASRGLRIFGSGTLSTRTSLVACHTKAFITPPALVVVEDRLPSARLAHGRRDLAGLQQLLEAAQIFPDGLVRLVTQHPGDRRADPPGRRVVLHVEIHLCAAVGTGRFEMDRAGADDVG